MMKRNRILTPLFVALGAAALLSACDMDVEDKGEMPDVDVEGGRLPDVDVRGPDVDVEKEQMTVPDVDVEVDEKEVTVPTLDVEPPKESGG
jgi:outer membrane lipopolysaccharide assembly protein LptE/RlpB